MKTIFVWKKVSGILPTNWHDGGGAVVIADSLIDACNLLLNEGVRNTSDILTKEPDYITKVEETEDKVFLFQDTGCC